MSVPAVHWDWVKGLLESRDAMVTRELRAFLVAKSNPPTLQHAVRTAAAGLASLLIARLFRLPEAYWSAISTLIVMQSTLGAALPVSAQRFAGTALGAAVGGVLGMYFPGNAWVFCAGVLALGLFCVATRLERAAYRYASITLAIVMLVTRANRSWTTALHRFVEVSIGIVVGLVASAIWPEKSRET